MGVANLASANAAIVDNLDGTYTITPAADFNGTLTLIYDVVDGQGGSTPTYAEGKVTPVNDAPEVDQGIANQSSNEDALFSFALPNDVFSDAEDSSLTLTATMDDDSALPSWLSFNGTTFSGTPTGLDTGVLSVKVTATDLQGETVEETFDLTINQVNDAPLVSGPLTTKPLDPYFNNVTLLLDFDGDMTDKSPQSVSVTNIGGLATSSAEARSGSASLAMPDNAGAAYAQVTDAATVDMGTASYTIEGWFFARDLGLANTYFSLIDETGYNTQITVDQGDAGGTARMFVGYGQPIVNFPGTFVANQWQHVALVRDAGADVFRLFVDGVQRGTLTDSIVDHDAVRLEIGTWTIDSPSYDRDFEGFVDELRVTKGIARYTSDFTVPDGPFPDAAGGGVAPYFTTNEDNAKTLSEAELLQNARDEDGDTLQVTNIAISGGNGTIVDNLDGTWTVTPDDDFNGMLTVTYDVSDGQVATSTYAEIVVTASNDTPEVDQGIANQNVDEEAAFNFEVPSDAFSDVDDVSLTLSATLADDSPLPSWLNFNGTTFTGTPDDPEVGTITVKVTATDSLGASVDETFDLTVNAVNDAPVVSAPLEVVPGDADFGDVVLLLHMDGDLSDSSSLSQTITNVGSFATGDGESKFGGGALDMTSQAGSTYLSVQDTSMNMGTGDYTIEGWFNATELGYDHALFTLIGSGGDNKILVEQSGTNGSARMFVGGGVPLVGMSNVFVEDQWQHVALVRDASAGLFRLFVDGAEVGTLMDSVTDHDTMRIEIGSWSFNSDRDFVGHIDEFRVTKGVARYTSNFTVPDAPFADSENVDAPFATTEQTSVIVSTSALLVNATDMENDTLDVDSLTVADATIVNNNDGTFTITPDSGFTGTLTLNYDVIDGNGGATSTYAEVLVTVGNEAPVAVEDAASTDEDTAIIVADGVNVLANDTDADLDTLSVTDMSVDSGSTVRDANALEAALNIASDGTVTFDPTGLFEDLGPGESETFDVIYTVNDGSGAINATTTETLTITVNGVNDGPVVSGPLVATQDDPHFDDVILLTNFNNGYFTDQSTENQTVNKVGGITTTAGDTPFDPNTGSAASWPSAASSPGHQYIYVEDASLDMGTGDYTIEGWYKPTNLALARHLFALIDNTAPANMNQVVGVDIGGANGQLRLMSNGGSPIIDTAPGTFSANEWHHVAVVRNDDTWRLFVDGSEAAALTVDQSSHNAVRLEIGTWTVNGDRDFEGLIDEFRVTKGIARYTEDFAVPDQPFAEDGNFTPAFETTEDVEITISLSELLTHASDIDGGTLGVINLASQDANIVDNLDGTWTITPDDDFNGILTLTYDIIDGQGGQVSTYAEVQVNPVDDMLAVDQGISDQSTQEEAAFSFQVPENAFEDVDGDMVMSATLGDDSPLPSWLSFDVETGTFTGIPDDPEVGAITVKVTATDAQGSVSDTFDLTVTPVNDAPVVSGPLVQGSNDPNFDDVVLLLHMDGGLVDSSSHDHTVTNVGGLATTSGESKFGSGSLDMTATAGNTYLSVEDSALDMGTGDYTIEGWFYATELGGDNALFTLHTSAGANKILVEQDDPYGGARMYVGAGSPIQSMPNVFISNTWQHVALVRDASAGLFRLYVDGTERGTMVDNVSDHDTLKLEIGTWSFNDDRDFTGYIDEFRVTKGLMRYTSTFTPPDDPFPHNITPFETTEQTSLLINTSALLANAIDVDEDTLSVANLSVVNATVVDNSDGTFTITPDSGFTGTLTLNYDVIDGNGGSASTYAEVLVSAAGAGADEITGTTYDDTLFGGTGNDTLSGGDGDDVLIGGDDDDTLNGGADDDRLFGQDDDDHLSGGAGDDLLEGGDGADILSGGADNDHLIGGGGSDTLTGGDGDDILEGDICHADPAGGSKSANGLTVAAWQMAGVSLSARGLDGNPAALTFADEGGYTKVGVDGGSQSAGQVNHEEAGNTEALIADFAATVTSATVTFTNLFSNEDGGEQGLWRAYDAVGNLVGEDTFGPADVTTANNVGTFTVSGIGSFDRLEFPAIPTVNEEAESDTEPGDSSDYFIAQIDYVAEAYTAGDDTLDGGAGNDMLCAGHGNDDLIGGLGQDVLEGGAGSDVFIYTSDDESGVGASLRDVINDFNAGTSTTAVDSIDISAIVTGTFDFLGAETETFGNSGNTEARFNDSTKILEIDADGDAQVDMEIELKDVDIANLDDSDFTTT